MFEAQSQGAVTSIDLRLSYDAATDLDPPDPEREGWKKVFVDHVFLRVILNPTDGLEANGIQCAFFPPPAIDGRFWISRLNSVGY